MQTKAPIHKNLRLVVHLLSWFFILLLLSSCVIFSGDVASSDPTETPAPTKLNRNPRPGSSSAEAEATVGPEGESGAPELLGDVYVATRTPMPTDTPGTLVEGASELTEQLGLDQQTILGL